MDAKIDKMVKIRCKDRRKMKMKMKGRRNMSSGVKDKQSSSGARRFTCRVKRRSRVEVEKKVRIERIASWGSVQSNSCQQSPEHYSRQSSKGQPDSHANPRGLAEGTLTARLEDIASSEHAHLIGRQVAFREWSELFPGSEFW
jgi:hypothetical protein